jgi:hypothetical protein
MGPRKGKKPAENNNMKQRDAITERRAEREL